MKNQSVTYQVYYEETVSQAVYEDITLSSGVVRVEYSTTLGELLISVLLVTLILIICFKWVVSLWIRKGGV